MSLWKKQDTRKFKPPASFGLVYGTTVKHLGAAFWQIRIGKELVTAYRPPSVGGSDEAWGSVSLQTYDAGEFLAYNIAGEQWDVVYDSVPPDHGYSCLKNFSGILFRILSEYSTGTYPGNLERSINGGKSWEVVFAGDIPNDEGIISIDQATDGTLWAAWSKAGGASYETRIYKSERHGELGSWILVYTYPVQARCWSIACHPLERNKIATFVIRSTGQGIYLAYTTDGGITWVDQDTGQNAAGGVFTECEVLFGELSRLIFSTGQSTTPIFITDDWGVTCTSTLTLPGSGAHYPKQMIRGTDNEIFYTFQRALEGYIARSIDNGATWDNVWAVASTVGMSAFSSLAYDRSTETLYWSSAGIYNPVLGYAVAKWTEIGGWQDISADIFAVVGSELLGVRNISAPVLVRGLSVGDKVAIEYNESTGHWVIVDGPISARVLVAARVRTAPSGTMNSFFAWTFSSKWKYKTWDPTELPPYINWRVRALTSKFWLVLNMEYPDPGYGDTHDVVVKCTRNGGKTWSALPNPSLGATWRWCDFALDTEGWLWGIAYEGEEEHGRYGARGQSACYCSQDQGLTWTLKWYDYAHYTADPDKVAALCLRCHPTDKNRIVIFGQSSLSAYGIMCTWQSSDRGESWEWVESTNLISYNDMGLVWDACICDNGRLVWWSLRSTGKLGMHLKVSDDGGLTWTTKWSLVWANAFRTGSIAHNKSGKRLFICTGSGTASPDLPGAAYFSGDYGDTWTKFDNDPPDTENSECNAGLSYDEVDDALYVMAGAGHSTSPTPSANSIVKMSPVTQDGEWVDVTHDLMPVGGFNSYLAVSSVPQERCINVIPRSSIASSFGYGGGAPSGPSGDPSGSFPTPTPPTPPPPPTPTAISGVPLFMQQSGSETVPYSRRVSKLAEVAGVGWLWSNQSDPGTATQSGVCSLKELGGNFYRIVMLPSSIEWLQHYLMHVGQLQRSTNEGITWVDVGPSPIPDVGNWGVNNVCIDAGGILWLCTCWDFGPPTNPSQIFKSTDNGITWTLSHSESLPWGSYRRIVDIFAHPTDANVIVAVGEGYDAEDLSSYVQATWVTTNAGASWSRNDVATSIGVSSCGYVHGVMLSSGRILCYNTDTYGYSDDYGTSWTVVDDDGSIFSVMTQFLRVPGDIVFGASIGWGARRSIDHGETWELLFHVTAPGDPRPMGLAYCRTNDTVYISTNSAKAGNRVLAIPDATQVTVGAAQDLSSNLNALWASGLPGVQCITARNTLDILKFVPDTISMTEIDRPKRKMKRIVTEAVKIVETVIRQLT